MARPVLIFDINNEYGEYGIKTMRFEHLPAFMAHPTPQIRRIAPFKYTPKGPVKMNTREMLAMLEAIVNQYMGGCLVVEDPTKFFAKSMTDDLIGAICTNRHNSCDMILHYQSVGRILPALHENINLYRFHHQGDDVNRSKNKLEETTEIFKIAQILVDTQFFGREGYAKNKYYFVYIDKDSGKLVGDFTKAEFDRAVRTFINFNSSELRPWLHQKNEHGSKLYSYTQAVDEFIKLATEKYWGNDDEPDLSAPREAKMMAAIGFKGAGKTVETLRQLVLDYCPGVVAVPPDKMKLLNTQAASPKKISNS